MSADKVKVGDLVDYKRDGLSGYQQYRVIGIRVMDGGRLKLKVAAHGLAPRWITERGILRVIPQQAVA